MQGNWQAAYCLVGIATHNIQDMFSPAHSHAIPHIPKIAPDDFDKYPTVDAISGPDSVPKMYSSIAEIVWRAARIVTTLTDGN